MQESPGVVGILDTYGAPVAPPRTISPYNSLEEEEEEEEATPEPEDDGFQSFRNQWEPMFIEKAAVTKPPISHVFVKENDLVRTSLESLGFTEILFSSQEPETSVEIGYSLDSPPTSFDEVAPPDTSRGIGYSLDSPPTFDELAPIEEGNKSETITRIVDCIREITTSTADSDCSQLSNEKNRQAKEEPLSFVLSIEPVHENVLDLTRQHQSNGQGRNPKAVFVMLPNIDPEDGQQDQLGVDGFFLDNIRAEALVADNEGDDGSGELRTSAP